jgi:hypothetical protein
MEQDRVEQGQAQAADSVRAAVDSAKVRQREPAKGKAEVAVGAAKVWDAEAEAAVAAGVVALVVVAKS